MHYSMPSSASIAHFITSPYSYTYMLDTTFSANKTGGLQHPPRYWGLQTTPPIHLYLTSFFPILPSTLPQIFYCCGDTHVTPPQPSPPFFACFAPELNQFHFTAGGGPHVIYICSLKVFTTILKYISTARKG